MPASAMIFVAGWRGTVAGTPARIASMQASPASRATWYTSRIRAVGSPRQSVGGCVKARVFGEQPFKRPGDANRFVSDS